MDIFITPSDIIKRCLFLEWKRFCLRDKTDEEIKNIILEDSIINLKEEDAFVIGLLKIVDTPNLIHRFKEYIEDFLKIRSSIVNNRLYIRSSDILKEVILFKNCFPDYFNPSFEYKQGIDDLKEFIDKIYPQIEKLPITDIPNKEDKMIEHYSSNSIKTLLYPKKDKSTD